MLVEVSYIALYIVCRTEHFFKNSASHVGRGKLHSFILTYDVHVYKGSAKELFDYIVKSVCCYLPLKDLSAHFKLSIVNSVYSLHTSNSIVNSV